MEECHVLGGDACLPEILELVRRHTGLDLARYRAAMIERRIANRMIMVGARSLLDYLAYLRGSHDEAAHLIRHISIKVSRFYRNPAAFDFLRSTVMPELAACGRVAVWCVGAARGEEAYTLAMLLEDARIEGEVYATDIDPEALAQARRARYTEAAVADVPDELRSRHLQPLGAGAWTVTDRLRQRVRFALHDVTSGGVPATAGPFHLVCCRNVLIYLNQDVHLRVFRTLRAALAPPAYLFLGEAEWPPVREQGTLKTASSTARVFRRA